MPAGQQPLSIQDHRRDSAGMTYVYPVVSRRAGGVSIGINLNPNNACNWHCVYCQVPGLKRGGPPPIDLAQLETELRSMLDNMLRGTFFEDRVPAESRQLIDVAFSGNGEPTSAREFPEAVAIAARVLREEGLLGRVVLRVITNGSLVDRPWVRAGLVALGAAGGEVWFKVDGATPEAIARVNGVHLKVEAVERRLATCAALCRTWVQTCLFAMDGKPPGENELEALIALLARASATTAGVHLYGLARPSCQNGAKRLGRLSAEWLETLANRMRRHGLTVRVSP